MFAQKGEDGVDGADGGSTYASPDGDYIFAGNIGDITGGANGNDVEYSRNSGRYYITAYGGGGGGASNYETGYDGADAEQLTNAIVNAGNGGDGAEGNRDVEQANNGQGGRGGDGGGGGGGGGGLQKSSVSPWQDCEVGVGGNRGLFGYGGDGGDGWAAVLF